MNEHIIVYGDFTLDLKKYPRIGSAKEKTDIIIITFLMHEEELTKCAKSLDDSIKYFNACKEYFYTYHTPDRAVKRYSAKEIIQIHQMLSMRPIRTSQEYFDFIRHFEYKDQCYISYLRGRDFYMNLFQSVKAAKDAHFERREFSYRVLPPLEIYGHMKKPILGELYSAYELMELFTFTHYLKNHHIIKELPIPSFMTKVQEETEKKYMGQIMKPVEDVDVGEEEPRKLNRIYRFKKEERIEEKSKIKEEKSVEEVKVKVKEKRFIKREVPTYEKRERITNTSLWDSNFSNILN
jgi:hypothetical protein